MSPCSRQSGVALEPGFHGIFGADFEDLVRCRSIIYKADFITSNELIRYAYMTDDGR